MGTPLIRNKVTNEHVMAFIFVILLMYKATVSVQGFPFGVKFFIVLLSSFVIDIIGNLINHKKLVCSVSAGITCMIIQILFPQASIMQSILAVAVSLIVGKHLWGGTGKNILNPAMLGIIVLSFFVTPNNSVFNESILLVIASILSLIILVIRPYAGLGFILGGIIGLQYIGNLSSRTVLTLGIIFFATMIFTDPVTITNNPFIGGLGGLICGFSALIFFNFNMIIVAIAVLAFNIISVVTDKFIYPKGLGKIKGTKLEVEIKDKKYVDDKKYEVQAESDLNLHPQEIISRIKINNVLGLGGGGFPSYKKIMGVLNSSVSKKYFIVNGVECDPGLIHDKYIMDIYSNEINQAIELICRCINFNRVIVATKQGKQFNSKFEVFKVPNIYPAGFERYLIENILNKKIEERSNPAEQGILVLNIQTLYSIYEAVYLNKKITSKFITVADLKNKTYTAMRVSLGDKIQDIIEGLYKSDGIYYKGGGIMQAQRVNDDAEVDCNTNFLAANVDINYKESPQCSKCGKCVKNCPQHLAVYQIASCVEHDNLNEAVKYNPNKCIQCGLCSYYCLAGKKLSNKVFKAKVFCENQKLD